MDRAVVLGASGLLGKATVDALLAKDISTRVLVRDTQRFKANFINNKLPGVVQVVQGDLDSNHALAQACEYADAIFLCFNTAYSKWSSDLTRWIARVSDIAAALESHLIFPGSLLNFGRHPNESITEEEKQRTSTIKGQLRISIEQRLIRASMEGAGLTILRFPDVYGPAMSDPFLTPMVKSAIAGQPTEWPTNPDVLHDFLYAEDAGTAMVAAALEPKAIDTVLHFPGPQPVTVREWIDLLYEQAGTNPTEKIIPVSWKTKLKGFVNKEVQEMEELQYVYETPLVMTREKYELLIGKPALTPHEEGIKQTIDWFRKHT